MLQGQININNIVFTVYEWLFIQVQSLGTFVKALVLCGESVTNLNMLVLF